MSVCWFLFSFHYGFEFSVFILCVCYLRCYFLCYFLVLSLYVLFSFAVPLFILSPPRRLSVPPSLVSLVSCISVHAFLLLCQSVTLSVRLHLTVSWFYWLIVAWTALAYWVCIFAHFVFVCSFGMCSSYSQLFSCLSLPFDLINYLTYLVLPVTVLLVLTGQSRSKKNASVICLSAIPE